MRKVAAQEINSIDGLRKLYSNVETLYILCNPSQPDICIARSLW